MNNEHTAGDDGVPSPSLNSRPARAASALFLVLAVSLTFGLAEVGAKPIVFFDQSYDSALVHNRVAAFIAEHGFGHEVDYLFADTVPGIEGLRRGDIDVALELWPTNLGPIWDDAIADGSLLDIGVNMPNGPQGWYVPTYVIEGDAERGIEPVAPDLHSVHDLAEHWELFKDPENPRKGRLYNGPFGWPVSEHNVERVYGYGLDEYFDVFHPGSQAALDTSIMQAYELGEPWVGYYWEPTWLMGMYDMTLLDEPPHYDGCQDEGGDFACALPVSPVHIAVTPSLPERAPEFVEFLTNYETELDQVNAALAYMQTTDGEPDDAAVWFMDEYESLWMSWLEPDVAAKVKAAFDALD